MQRIFVLVLSMLAIAPAARAEVTWSGGAGVRHLIRVLNDGLGTKTLASGDPKDTSKTVNKRWEYRASLGAAGKGEEIDWGIDLRTQPAGSVTSEWISSSLNTDYGVGLGQAYGRLKKKVWDTDVAVTVGRAKTVLFYDNLAQSLFDNDIRWDGFGWTIKRGNFGLNLAQYVIGANNQGTPGSSSLQQTEASDANAQAPSSFAYLFSFQPWIQLKFPDDITTTVAVAYHNWSGTQGNVNAGFYNNAVHGGTAGTVGDITSVPMDNAKQWHFLGDTALPWNLRLVGEFIRNKKVFYGGRAANPRMVETVRNAWAVSLFWGKPKKAGDVGFGYSYSNKGIGSVISTYTNGDIPADNISHFFEGKYFLTDGLSFTGKAQFHKEKENRGGDGYPLGTPNEKRNQTQQRYEFVTTIQY